MLLPTKVRFILETWRYILHKSGVGELLFIHILISVKTCE